jgi:hypothetical protein
MNTKSPPYLPSFTLSSCSPLPLVPTLREDLFYLPVLHFLKCVLIAQGSSTLVSQTCLIRLTCVTYSFSTCLSPITQQPTVHCVMVFSYTDAMCFNLFSIIFFLLLPPYSSYRSTICHGLSLSLSLYIYTHIYIHIYTYTYMNLCVHVILHV